MELRMNEQEAIDHLLGIGGPKLVIRMIGVFLEKAPAHLESIRQGEKAKDWDSVARSAHAFKSSVGNFGAGDLYDGLSRIEQLANEKNCKTIPKLIDDVFDRFELVRERLLDITEELKE